MMLRCEESEQAGKRGRTMAGGRIAAGKPVPGRSSETLQLMLTILLLKLGWLSETV